MNSIKDVLYAKISDDNKKVIELADRNGKVKILFIDKELLNTCEEIYKIKTNVFLISVLLGLICGIAIGIGIIL